MLSFFFALAASTSAWRDFRVAPASGRGALFDGLAEWGALFAASSEAAETG